MVGRNPAGEPDWHEAGRSHDGSRGESWWQADYRLGNAQLYRLAAESLRTAEDETMGYDQGRFHDPGLTEVLSLHRIPAESRIVTDEMAAGIAPCETAACVAGHVYVCARGWRDYLGKCVRATGEVPTSEIGNTAAAELGMTGEQHCALFPAQPALEEVIGAFGITPEDWTCPASQDGRDREALERAAGRLPRGRHGPIFEYTRHGTAVIENRNIVLRPASHRHRIRLRPGPVLNDGSIRRIPAMTLFQTGKRVQRWGFEQPDGSIKPVASKSGEVPRR